MKIETLKKNSEFRRAYARGKAYADPALITYVVKNRAGVCRMGITASKKIGNAVERNRARRVIRAAAEMLGEFEAGYDLVFVARTKTVFRKSTDIRRVMKKQLTSAGVLHEKK